MMWIWEITDILNVNPAATFMTSTLLALNGILMILKAFLSKNTASIFRESAAIASKNKNNIATTPLDSSLPREEPGGLSACLKGRSSVYNGLIIEGISGTGKSELLHDLVDHPRFTSLPTHSRLILSEYHTQRVLELKENQHRLTIQDHLDLLDQHVTTVEKLQKNTLARGWNMPELDESDLFFIFERFHLTHVFRFPYMKWHHVASIDERLSHLGAKLCILTVEADILEERLFLRKNQCWLQYLSQYGNTPGEIVAFLMNRQRILLELIQKTCLPVLQMDTSHQSIESLSETVLDSVCKYSSGSDHP